MKFDSRPPAAVTQSAFAGLIGVAREDITPPVGIYARNWGAAQHDKAEGIHRPLTLTALTLQERKDSAPLVLVAFDLGWWRNASDELALRRALLDALNLDEARLMMCLSHTHAGPSQCREDADKPGGELIAPYLEQVLQASTAAVKRAQSAAVPAVLEWAWGACSLAHNRDLPDAGRDRVVVGYNPGVPADNTILVGRVTGENGAVLATLVNYACHPVTLAWQNRLVSPDYVGALRERVEAHTRGAPLLFLQGASGELAPREQYTGDLAIAEANGRVVGHAVIAVLESMLPAKVQLEFSGVVESGAPLATWTRKTVTPSTVLRAVLKQVEFPLQPIPPLAEIERQLAQTGDRVAAERLRRKRGVRRNVGDGSTTKQPLWVWRVGGAILAAQPNEAYSLLQLEVRKRLAPAHVAVMNLVNGSCGYLPPSDLYTRDIYQVWQSPFAAGSLEKLLEECASAAQALA